MFKDVWRWFLAVANHWLWFVGCGVVSAFGWYWTQYGNGPLPTWLFKGGAVFGIVAAMYLAWLDEHDGRLIAEGALKKDAPDFTCYINQMAFEDPVDNVCTAYLLLSVENIGGRRSILHNFRTYVLPPNGLEQEVPTSDPPHGEDAVLISPQSGNEIRFALSEFITFKSYPNPIEPGAGCRGFLKCNLPAGLPDGTKFIVRFKDVDKREYSGEYDTAMRRKRADDVGATKAWAGVEIRHGRATVKQAPLGG